VDRLRDASPWAPLVPADADVEPGAPVVDVPVPACDPLWPAPVAPDALIPVVVPAREVPAWPAVSALVDPAPVLLALRGPELDAVLDAVLPVSVDGDVLLPAAPELLAVLLEAVPAVPLVPAAEVLVRPVIAAPLAPVPRVVLAPEAAVPCVPARYCRSPGSPAIEELVRVRPDVIAGQFASSSIPDQV
jgi:hypothetical protein